MEYLLLWLQYCHNVEIQQLICTSWTWNWLHYVSVLSMFYGIIVTGLEYSDCTLHNRLYLFDRGVHIHTTCLISFFIINSFYCLDGTRCRFFGHIPSTLEGYIPLDEELISLSPVAMGFVYEFNWFDNYWENYKIYFLHIWLSDELIKWSCGALLFGHVFLFELIWL